MSSIFIYVTETNSMLTQSSCTIFDTKYVSACNDKVRAEVVAWLYFTLFKTVLISREDVSFLTTGLLWLPCSLMQICNLFIKSLDVGGQDF